MPDVNKPFITVIIPVHNSAEFLNHTLDALTESSYKQFEIIVVDDASNDESIDICKSKGIRAIQLPNKSGPAAARNVGARNAKGDILLFIDSDVLVNSTTLARIAEDFIGNPNISAVFGSYDESPLSKDVLSQFKNLLHHYIHMNSDEKAKTFWAGCGAIYREVYLQFGGFNELRYSNPSIEDIELGIRLWRSGHQILLDKNLQVKHLKKWSLLNLLRTDIFDRALPWSRLILESEISQGDLNLKSTYKISALLVGFLLIAFILILLHAISSYEFLSLRDLTAFLIIDLILLIILNRDIYKFFLDKRGIKFMIFSIPLHFLYYLYSGISFLISWIIYKIRLSK